MAIRSKRPTETPEDYIIHRLRQSLEDMLSLRVRYFSVDYCGDPKCSHCARFAEIVRAAQSLVNDTVAYK